VYLDAGVKGVSQRGERRRVSAPHDATGETRWRSDAADDSGAGDRQISAAIGRRDR